MANRTTSRRASQTPYNGHPNWNLWNVALHFSNNYDTYHQYLDLLRRKGLKGATEDLYHNLGDTKTSDGARYTKVAIRHGLRCLRD